MSANVMLREIKLSNTSPNDALVVWGALEVGSEPHRLYQQWRYKRGQGMWDYVFGRRDGTGGCIACYRMCPDGMLDVWHVQAFEKHPSQYEGGLPDPEDGTGWCIVRTLRQDLTGLDIQVRRECHGREDALFPAIYAAREKLGGIVWVKS
jgi:hypothetical protein